MGYYNRICFSISKDLFDSITDTPDRLACKTIDCIERMLIEHPLETSFSRIGEGSNFVSESISWKANSKSEETIKDLEQRNAFKEHGVEIINLGMDEDDPDQYIEGSFTGYDFDIEGRERELDKILVMPKSIEYIISEDL